MTGGNPPCSDDEWYRHSTPQSSDCTVSPIIPMERFFFKQNPSKLGQVFRFDCVQSSGVELYAQHRFYVSGGTLRRGTFPPPAGPSVGKC